MKGLNVVSLFDGMSCGQLALSKLGKEVSKYYASEINKDAISITMDNFPETIQLGNIQQIKHIDWAKENIDLLIGGSPCQGFSFAGNLLNFEDSRSILFFEYLRILKEIQSVNPGVKFLLENVKMKKEHLKIISDCLGVEPVFIDSSNFSAHNRPRYYWTNIAKLEDMPRIKHGAVLKDILEIYPNSIPDYLYLKDYEIERGYRKNAAQTFKSGGKCGAVEFPTSISKKSKTLTKLEIKASREATHVVDKNGIRLLTRLERERLQNLPEGYTKIVSDKKAFPIIGDSWTVCVICFILSHL